MLISHWLLLHTDFVLIQISMFIYSSYEIGKKDLNKVLDMVTTMEEGDSRKLLLVTSNQYQINVTETHLLWNASLNCTFHFVEL